MNIDTAPLSENIRTAHGKIQTLHETAGSIFDPSFVEGGDSIGVPVMPGTTTDGTTPEQVAAPLSSDVKVTLPIKLGAPKAGRNDPCPCGSGRKFKKCCVDQTRTEKPLHQWAVLRDKGRFSGSGAGV